MGQFQRMNIPEDGDLWPQLHYGCLSVSIIGSNSSGPVIWIHHTPAHPMSFKKEGMLSDHIASTNIARRYVLRVEIKTNKQTHSRNQRKIRITCNLEF